MFEKGRDAIWPAIHDEASAVKAVHLGVIAAIVNAGATLVASNWITYWSLVDVGLAAIIGFFIFKRSRIAAVLGVLMCAANLVYKIDVHGTTGILPFLMLYYINGVRGTFAYHRFKAMGPARDNTPKTS